MSVSEINVKRYLTHHGPVRNMHQCFYVDFNPFAEKKGINQEHPATFCTASEIIPNNALHSI